MGSININSVKYINKRRGGGGYYANAESLKKIKEIIDEAYDHALKEASFEVCEGKISLELLMEKADQDKIKTNALELLEI